MLTGKHKIAYENLVKDNKWLTEQLDAERIARINAEALLTRARHGDDEETNAFFRTKSENAEIEQARDAEQTGKLAKKARAKKN